MLVFRTYNEKPERIMKSRDFGKWRWMIVNS